MKQFTLILTAILLGLATMAQTPQSFSYQAIARTADGDPIVNRDISVKISILAGSASGTVVYSELHDANTNSMGLFSFGIGNPTEVLSGVFSEITWGANDYFLKLEMDETGGNNFTEMGTTQLLSVPYALWSEYTAHPEDADADPLNELQTVTKVGQTVTLSGGGGSFVDDVDDADADPLNELQTLSQNGLDVTLSQGGGTISVADNDNQPYNELQQLTKVGSTVTLSQGGGSFTDAVNDADYNPGNELQNLSNTKNGIQVTLNISNGTGTTVDVTDTDADPVNELQTLSQTDYNVTLSQGGSSIMTGVKSYTQAQINAMTPYNGLTIHNSTTNCINYYYLNNWFEACGTCTPQPTQAEAGDDQAFYDETLTATLAANTPEQGTGLWTVVIGEGGSFDDAGDPAATFTGEPCRDYTLEWDISNTCGSSADQVGITFFATPTQAFAGNDTVVEGGDVSLYLSANTPEIGNGLWSVLSGEGGTFEDDSNPVTLFTGLPEINYTLRWEIYTACDTTYDEVTVAFYTWQCGSPYTDARDGQTYETVQIEEQCWMAENLAYLPEVSPSSQGNNTDSYYYVYDYQGTDVAEAKATENYQNYGSLYNWPASLTACPTDWHLPTDAEWTVLTDHLGGTGVAGGKMKSTRTAPDPHPRWNSPNTGATNTSGFSGLPGGTRSTNGTFYYLGNFGYFWSSTEHSTTYAWGRNLGYSGDRATEDPPLRVLVFLCVV
nr:hypothetical protein [Bacteroidota bacterium]